MPDEADALGVALGAEGYAAQHCEGVARRASNLLEKLADLPNTASPHLPATQAAALLLRHCGPGKLTHLLRSTPPTSTRAAAEAYDDATLAACRRLLPWTRSRTTTERSAGCRCASGGEA